jgi:hypothetical protein
LSSANAGLEHKWLSCDGPKLKGFEHLLHFASHQEAGKHGQ